LDTDGDGVGDNAQAAAEAKAAKLAAEQREMYMMIGIAAVVIILSLAAVMFFIKKKDGDEPVLTTKEYDTPQPLPQTQPVSPQLVEFAVMVEVCHIPWWSILVHHHLSS
jgi:flagellar basal body-associated protein FliL